jgi:amino acid transporter
VELAVVLVVFVAFINLRGMKESGTIFAIPTYAFVLTLGAAVTIAITKILMAGENPLSAGEPTGEVAAVQGITFFLVLRAFANGCAAMTGVEAISNGVQAFRAPSAVNANRTLALMAVILGSLFIGVTLVARNQGFIPAEDSTIPSQLGAAAFGPGSPLFAFLQLMTAGILVLAANTAFADFPRLAAILARDGFLPRALQVRGNRLVFTSGISALSVLAILLLIVFNAETTRLIPLYALGVFLSFTLSQYGMVLHWKRTHRPRWKRRALTNGFGATATGIVTAVILTAKFSEGAWIILVVLPTIASALFLVSRFHRRLRRSLFVPADAIIDLVPRGDSHTPTIVPVEDIDLASVMALGAACERSRDVRAVHVHFDPDARSTLKQRWQAQFPRLPLVLIDSPYRTVADPIASYAEELVHEPPYRVDVIVPVVEVRHRYERPLVNQALKRLPGLLANRQRVSVTLQPFSEGGPRRRRRKE